MLAPSTTLSTARLRLEPVEQRHIDGLRQVSGDAGVMRLITGRAETPEETAAFVARHQRKWTQLGYAWWAFVVHDSGAIVGAGCVQNIEYDLDNPLELCWRLRADQEGKGYATEAALAMAQFAFQQLRASEVLALCHPDNISSAAVMRRIGMRHQGVKRWYGADQDIYRLVPGHEPHHGGPVGPA